MSNPASADSNGDIQLLADTVNYFQRIRSSLDSGKAEQASSAFMKIAESAMRKVSLDSPCPFVPTMLIITQQMSDPQRFHDTIRDVPTPFLQPSKTSSQNQQSHQTRAQANDQYSTLPTANMAFIPFLKWPQQQSSSAEAPPLPPTDFTVDGVMQGRNVENTQTGQTQTTASASQFNPNDLAIEEWIDWAGLQAKQQPLDASFDWLAWDALDDKA